MEDNVKAAEELKKTTRKLNKTVGREYKKLKRAGRRKRES